MNAVDIRGLRKTYDNGFEALKGIDLTVEQGDFFALLGPNGAGKSTTIGILSSLVRKSDGEVHVFGHNLDTELGQAKSCIGLVPQEINFSLWENLTEILTNQAGYYGIPHRMAVVRAEIYLRKLGLWDKRLDLSRTLSGGLKRRLMIARALVHEPKLLILDEPTAGVDIELRRSMWEFLREINDSGTTIILTTHYLEEAETLCRRIAIIDQGIIVEDTNMKALLQRLRVETFVFDLRTALSEPPTLADYAVRMIDETTLEIELSSDGSVNDLFAALSLAGVEVTSMRNKANRLEELFLRMLTESETTSPAVDYFEQEPL